MIVFFKPQAVGVTLRVHCKGSKTTNKRAQERTRKLKWLLLLLKKMLSLDRTIKMTLMLERWEFVTRVAARLPRSTRQLPTALACKVQLVYYASAVIAECASQQPTTKAKTKRKYGASSWIPIVSVPLQPPALVGKRNSSALTPDAVRYFDLCLCLPITLQKPNRPTFLQHKYSAFPCDDKVPCLVTVIFMTCCYKFGCKPACCKTLADIDPEKYNHEQELDAIPQANVGYGAPLEIEAER